MLTRKNNISKENIFLAHLKEESPAQQKENFQPKKFLILAQTNQLFKTKKLLHRPERTDFLPVEKVSYTYPKMFLYFQKKPNFPSENDFL